MDKAELALERANQVIGRLHQTGMDLHLAESCWLKGKALVGLGKWNQAEEVLLQSRSLAEGINARRLLWQILAALAELEDRRGNADTAGSLRAQAREIITYIADHTGSEELSTSFRSLPEVQSVLTK